MVATVPEQETVALNIRNVPQDLRRRFKSLCANEEITMEHAVISLLEKVVDGKVELRPIPVCPNCYGTGEDEYLPGKFRICETCRPIDFHSSVFRLNEKE